ncbi:MAG: Uncharacterised protein [Prochlorococcus marinus str. MIT 9313]|nr:MAG: Uncharacterised protein [Prochlorococcus marinus str. MIT 9313]
MGHVAVGVDHHQQSDGGDQGKHHGSKGINHITHWQNETAGAGPDEEMFDRCSTGQLLGEDCIAQDGGST